MPYNFLVEVLAPVSNSKTITAVILIVFAAVFAFRS